MSCHRGISEDSGSPSRTLGTHLAAGEPNGMRRSPVEEKSERTSPLRIRAGESAAPSICEGIEGRYLGMQGRRRAPVSTRASAAGRVPQQLTPTATEATMGVCCCAAPGRSLPDCVDSTTTRVEVLRVESGVAHLSAAAAGTKGALAAAKSAGALLSGCGLLAAARSAAASGSHKTTGCAPIRGVPFVVAHLEEGRPSTGGAGCAARRPPVGVCRRVQSVSVRQRAERRKNRSPMNDHSPTHRTHQVILGCGMEGARR
jgi:hypothetical protein